MLGWVASRLKVLLPWMGLALSGCLPPSSSSQSVTAEPKTCEHVPSDQRGSFMAQVQGFPLVISADADFTLDQRQSLVRAVEQWNEIGQEVLKQDLFRLNFAVPPSFLKQLHPADCQVNFGGRRDFYIFRETDTEHWLTMGLNKLIPGATFRCEQSGQALRQIIYIYPELVDATQFSSIILHELGHTIGLNHSCSSLLKGRADFRSCYNLTINHPYRQAVMYPWLHNSSHKSELVEVKDFLQENDQVRAACELRAL